MNMQGIVKYFSLLLISIIVALIIAEGIFYLVPPLKEKYAAELFITKFSPLQWLDNPNAYYKFRSSNLLGHERIPNSAPNINSYGLIGDEFSIKKPKNVFRILVLGDSIAAQNYFIEFLKRKLNNLPTQTKFEIINAGIGSYQLWHYARFLKYKGIKFNPDMLLISFSLDDARIDKCTCYKTEKGFQIYSILTPEVLNKGLFNIFLFKHSYVYRVFIIALERLLAGSDQYDSEQEAIDNLRMIKQICQNVKIPVFGFIWPALIYFEHYTEWEKRQYYTLINSLEYVGIDFLDLSEFLSEEERGSLREWEHDYVHPSKKGHQIAGEAIFKQLMENYSKFFK
ncbi:MAG: SGNH/GDSL hydrolase family protein [Candidatus Omnitrophica bacterium]|nr:SGNH/GDSL hydrolase family protein [Candidatus Omnitrophota bacterium]